MSTARDFLAANPQLETLDLMIVDANGCLRGKRLPGDAIEDALDNGVLLPQSVYASNICGHTVRGTGMGIDSGDPDKLCFPEPETLRLVPGSNGCAAQCMLEMQDDDGVPLAASSRQVLRTVVAKFHERGLKPTVAVELEFFLVRNKLEGDGMPAQLLDATSGNTATQTQTLSLDDLDGVGSFIDQVRADAALQSVPASAASAEYAPGQFEINLRHTDDPLAACDDAVYLKRIVRRAAKQHEMIATFMAKPFEDLSGSGSHIHVSLQDNDGANRFEVDAQLLKYAIAGLQQTMPDSMLLFAPNANSYRRYQQRSYVPMSPSWGYNNRTVALRIPAGPADATRIEHRAPGADCNPYLAMAAVLSGILYGLDQRELPPPPVEGNAATQCKATLPTDWLTAINVFNASEWARNYFGAEFHTLLSIIKHAEFAEFQRQVPALDIEWYLHSA